MANLLLRCEQSLRARNRSPKTTTSYLQTVMIFREYRERVGMPTRAERITREHVDAFIAVQLAR